LDFEANRIVGVKNITANEPQFTGHFPDNPIMPGVLILEALAQTGCLLMLQSVDDVSKKLGLFQSVRNVKFRRPVVPGDQMIMEMTLINRKLNIFVFKGKATVDGVVVAEAEVQAALIDR
jgi:beta-hydroxyacyl-ACP dehydratase FabZ